MANHKVGDTGIISCQVGGDGGLISIRCRARIIADDSPCGYTVRLLQDAGPLKKGEKLGISFDEFQPFEVVR